MPLDPNIALSVKPIQLANPLEQYMQVQQIQQAQNQSRLADLMYNEKQQQITRGNNLLSLMKGLPQDATDDQRMSALRSNGYFDEADKLDTSIQNRTKTKAEAQKNQADAMGKYLDATKQVAGRVMAQPTLENASAALDGMESLGKQLGFDVSADIANERQQLAKLQTPEQIKQWAAAHSMQADKLLPKIDTRNLGGTTDTISIDPVSGKVTVVNSAKNTQSPDNAATVAATRRGQDMTDARARDFNATKVEENNIKRSEKAEEKNMTKQSQLASFDTMLGTLDRLSKHPGLPNSVGLAGALPTLPGSNSANFQAELNTFQSQAFLPMVAQLKGMGALSDAEGKKLTAAVGALDPRMGEQAFRDSVSRITADMAAARERVAATVKPAKTDKTVPHVNAKGWTLHTDANGNRAYVSPDGKSYEEVK